MNQGYSICLNEWALDTEIKNELPLLLIVSGLCAEKGYCFASNKYLADMFKTTEETISRKLKKLEEKKYISIEYQKYGFKVEKRFIRICVNGAIDENVKRAIDENINGAIDENVKEINTSINNTSINNNLGSAIDEFKRMRKSIKKPLTDNALNRLIKRLDAMADSDADKIEILNQSIDHCWQDIYPLKKKTKTELPVEPQEDLSEIIAKIERTRNH